jgi:hypothetical protein
VSRLTAQAAYPPPYNDRTSHRWPIWHCVTWGFRCGGIATRPVVSSPPFHPYHEPKPMAVCFCRTFRHALRRAQPLAGMLLCAAPNFLPHPRAMAAIVRSTEIRLLLNHEANELNKITSVIIHVTQNIIRLNLNSRKFGNIRNGFLENLLQDLGPTEKGNFPLSHAYG